MNLPEKSAASDPLPDRSSVDQAPLVSRAQLWVDRSPPPDGAWQMAIDEALFLTAAQPVLRFYQWLRPEVTFGFFTPLAEVHASALPLTRRWTGGGIVEHGTDLTFSLAIPRSHLPALPAGESYRLIHQALAAALSATGRLQVRAAPSETVARSAAERGLGASPGACFSKPVAWDVIEESDGTKIAGGAQRRTRQGLLHQGSVRLSEALRDFSHPWLTDFAERLAGSISVVGDPGSEVRVLAEDLRQTRYLHSAWHARF